MDIFLFLFSFFKRKKLSAGTDVIVCQPLGYCYWAVDPQSIHLQVPTLHGGTHPTGIHSRMAAAAAARGSSSLFHRRGAAPRPLSRPTLCFIHTTTIDQYVTDSQVIFLSFFIPLFFFFFFRPAPSLPRPRPFCCPTRVNSTV